MGPVASCLVVHGCPRARDRQFHRVGTVGRRSPGLDLRAGTLRGRQVRSRSDEVNSSLSHAYSRGLALRRSDQPRFMRHFRVHGAMTDADATTRLTAPWLREAPLGDILSLLDSDKE